MSHFPAFASQLSPRMDVPLVLPSAAPCGGCDAQVVRPTFSGFRDIWVPMVPGGRYVWTGEGDFTRAHAATTVKLVGGVCVGIRDHRDPRVCLKKVDEMYSWGHAVVVSDPVTCPADMLCPLRINRKVGRGLFVSTYTPSSRAEWVAKLQPSAPAGLGVALDAQMPNRTVSFRGPGTKVLYFKPLQWNIVAQAGASQFSVLVPLVTDAGELDGVFGLADPEHTRGGRVVYSQD